MLRYCRVIRRGLVRCGHGCLLIIKPFKDPGDIGKQRFTQALSTTELMQVVKVGKAVFYFLRCKIRKQYDAAGRSGCTLCRQHAFVFIFGMVNVSHKQMWAVRIAGFQYGGYRFHVAGVDSHNDWPLSHHMQATRRGVALGIKDGLAIGKRSTLDAEVPRLRRILIEILFSVRGDVLQRSEFVVSVIERYGQRAVTCLPDVRRDRYPFFFEISVSRISGWQAVIQIFCTGRAAGIQRSLFASRVVL